VLRAVYLVVTRAAPRATWRRAATEWAGTLCEQAIRLARALATLMPDEPDVTGLGPALKVGRPGLYQRHCATSKPVTDWPKAAALYGELAR
jgi:hypothetical protein